MFKFLIISLAITYCNAGNLAGAGLLAAGPGLGLAGVGLGLDGGLGLAGGYGVGLAHGGIGLAHGGIGLAHGGIGLAGGLGLGYGAGIAAAPIGAVGLAGPVGPVPAAIQSRRTYEVRPVLLPQEPAVPQIIEVEPSEQPVQVVFRSISSPVLVQQVHTPGAPGQVEATHSEDEPHRVVHEVLRPVIQEVREVIQPFRRVTQEVRPVLEEVHTVVAKGEPRLRTAVAPVAAAPIIAEGAALGLADGKLGGLGLGLGLAGGYGKGAYSKAASKAA